MKNLLAAAMAVALLAATPAPPSQSHSKAYKSLVTDAATLDANYDQVVRLFQKFAVSVYAPYCDTRGGLDHVGFSTTMNAWPAEIFCKADPKHPIFVKEPK